MAGIGKVVPLPFYHFGVKEGAGSGNVPGENQKVDPRGSERVSFS
jgi:hypothetical protein